MDPDDRLPTYLDTTRSTPPPPGYTMSANAPLQFDVVSMVVNSSLTSSSISSWLLVSQANQMPDYCIVPAPVPYIGRSHEYRLEDCADRRKSVQARPSLSASALWNISYKFDGVILNRTDLARKAPTRAIWSFSIGAIEYAWTVIESDQRLHLVRATPWPGQSVSSTPSQSRSIRVGLVERKSSSKPSEPACNIILSGDELATPGASHDRSLMEAVMLMTGVLIAKEVWSIG
ncbi:hypothetical protein BZG36_01713 [Bifiguratus adelaidae]|uniref:Uncharacterized protein n=1 Tax=Bifiguratus adelaidae TaxID=1938954 RepID=A0A261Y4N5_9FUNG|nr:hypothetical protein BZG36_01713 [Bifiguratus adelaidae]